MSSTSVWEYQGCLFPSVKYDTASLDYAWKEFEVRDTDVFNITYPKSGTTWMQEILTLIHSNGDPALSHSVPSWERVPWIEHTSGRGYLEHRPSPRLISSHLPAQLFPKSFFTSKAKAIYTVRNPRDILVSLHFFSGMTGFLDKDEDLDQLLSKFLRGKVIYGSWFDHIKGWLEVKDHLNLLLLSYEELLQDLRGSVVRICDFLGRQLDEAAIDSVVENATFKTMKDNKMANYSLVPKEFMDVQKSAFLRKGISGDWKNHFTPSMRESFEAAYKEAMKDIKVKFMWDSCQEDGITQR
ncbi:sulfotransferase family cytosolic 2B member 1-like [Rhinatrema bivittatum]|uniref:sulfotransferase family cytosolic 2B member 1-like n=1 Tax=Rhinatrema bivittatum TaxID=194408 RepID=UPI00112CFD87|nr:sulfotransferase family cytosolic 2B member 1-like [Rhinatrema bivittatum]